MKAKLIRDMDRLNRKVVDGQLVLEVEKNGHKAGTVIDGPKSYLLVRQGCAVPDDEECAKKAGMNPEAMQAAKKAYDRLEKAIASEDFEAFDRGLMIGYDPNGTDGDTWIHGPNWYDGCEAAYYSDNEDEDDDD